MHLLGLIVFKLYMQTVFNAHFHFDRVVDVRVGGQLMDNEVILLYQIRQPPHNCNFKEIPAETLKAH